MAPAGVEQEVIHLLVGITALHEVGLRGQGVTVALVDSAVDNPELAPWIIQRYGTEPAPQSGPVPRRHGDAMAAVIVQAAPAVRLVPINVFDRSGRVTRPAIAAGLATADERKDIQLVNVSLEIKRVPAQCSSEYPCEACRAVDRTVAAGKIVVVAVGNRGPEAGTVTCPGAATRGLSVGATIGPQPTRISETPCVADLTAAPESGTSVSAALLSGGSASLLSAFPDLAIRELKDALAATATQLPLASAAAVGAGRAHLFRAFRYLQHRRSGRPIDVALAQDLATSAVRAVRSEGGEASPRVMAEARDKLQRAIAVAPWGAQLHLWRARTMEQQDPPAALAAAAEAVRLEWSLPEAHNAIARLLRQQGDTRGSQVEEEVARHLANGDEIESAHVLFDGFNSRIPRSQGSDGRC